jgi:hypothetical protein
LVNSRGAGSLSLQQRQASGGSKEQPQHFLSGVSREQQHLLLTEQPQQDLVSNSGGGGEKAVVTTAARRNRRKYSLQFKVSVLGRMIIKGTVHITKMFRLIPYRGHLQSTSIILN